MPTVLNLEHLFYCVELNSAFIILLFGDEIEKETVSYDIDDDHLPSFGSLCLD